MGTGELHAVVEWIAAAMCVQFAHWTSSLVCTLFSVSCVFRRENVAFPGRILITSTFV